MIIWGTKGKTKVTGKGRFNCPVCRNLQTYHNIVVGKFFTLYFVPLFKTKTIGEYIECQNCHMTFKPEVLQWSRGYVKAQNDANRMVKELKKELESGVPIQSMMQAFLGRGIEKETAALVIMEATNNELRKCRSCNLDFIGSLRYCPQCGNELKYHRY